MNKYDGGSAFPESYVGADRPHEGIGGGMSMRDYFAAAALKGLCAKYGNVLLQESCYTGNHIEISRMAYIYAEAMLKERAK